MKRCSSRQVGELGIGMVCVCVSVCLSLFLWLGTTADVSGSTIVL